MSVTPTVSPLICPSSNIPGLSSVNGSAFTAVKVGGSFTDVGNALVVNGVSVTNYMAETTKRLDLLESNIKALPAVVSEAIISVFKDIPTSHLAPVFTIQSLNNFNSIVQAGQTIYPLGNTATTTGMGVDLSAALNTMVGMVIQQLSAKINYDELNKLRDRIRQLEEDMGYREAVAKKLMEE